MKSCEETLCAPISVLLHYYFSAIDGTNRAHVKLAFRVILLLVFMQKVDKHPSNPSIQREKITHEKQSWYLTHHRNPREVLPKLVCCSH